jgi:hypothetical protein
MRVTALKLANVRAIEAAEFRFKPGFNLIVGVNGVGKTTVLEAISRGLAQAIEKTSNIAVTQPALATRDIRHGAIAATTLLELELADQTVQVRDQRFRPGVLPARPGDLRSEVDVYAHGLQRRGRLKRAQRQAQETVHLESGPRLLPDEKTFRVAASNERTRLLAVYFSTSRASPSRAGVRTRRAVRAPASAYVDAFTGRELRLRSFAPRSSSSNKLPTSLRVLSAMATLFGFAMLCKRAARFGVSPTMACSCEAPDPIRSPTTTSPVAMPTRV